MPSIVPIGSKMNTHMRGRERERERERGLEDGIMSCVLAACDDAHVEISVCFECACRRERMPCGPADHVDAAYPPSHRIALHVAYACVSDTSLLPCYAQMHAT